MPAGVSHAAPQSSSGEVTVGGVITSPPPSTPPTIEEPAPGTTFTTKSIVVRGSCISDLVVRIYRNNFFAGSTLCQADGTYSLHIDLFIGQNDLVAKQFDSLNQESPPSATVTVFYTLPAPTLPGASPGAGTTTQPPGETPTQTAQFQLIIEYDYTLQTVFVGKPFTLPIAFTGGTPPYAINIDWGDGQNSVFSRQDTSRFNVDHTYEKAGYYTVKITVSDKNGETASLEFVILVSGQDEQSPLIRAVTGTDIWTQIAIGIIFIASLVAAFIIGTKMSSLRRSKE